MPEPLLPLTEPVSCLADYLAGGGGLGLAAAIGRDRRAVLAEVRAAGLRGRGGGGLPTATKWASALDRAGPVYLVCNAAEARPGAFKDRFILRRNPYQVIEGIAIAAYALAATRAFIAITRTFVTEIAALQTALTEMCAADLLGPTPIQLVYGPDEYLFGAEAVLVEVIKRGKPWPETPETLPRRRLDRVDAAGVVNNVETLAHLPAILRKGAKAFRACGTDDSPGTAVFTVSGDVRQPGVYELPLGLPLRTVLELVCGGALPGRTVQAVFAGTGAAPLAEHTLDTPLDVEEMHAVGSALGVAGFVVYDDSACVVAAALACARPLADCGSDPAALVDFLDRVEAGDADSFDVDIALAACARIASTDHIGISPLVGGLLTVFAAEVAAHLGRACPRPRPLPVPKLVDFDTATGRFSYDPRYA